VSALRTDSIVPFTSGIAISFGLSSFPEGISGALNATSLGGESGSYYLNYANFTGTPQVSGSFTGTLSGTASNADFLDGLDSTYFRDGANLTGTINATQLDGQTSAYYRNAANLSGTAQLSGSFTGSFSGNLTGTASLSGTFSGAFRSNASTTGSASINLPHGTAPTSPVDGDLWTTNSGLYVQISGSSIGPLTTGGGGADEFTKTIALIGL